MISFNYETAFSRNIGWVTEEEQKVLKGSRVAIGGMGGVGGWHLITLARMGVGKFNLSDFDTFDLVNFNRQAGASMATVGRPKLEVMLEMLREINPEVEVNVFPDGLNENNRELFLKDVDVYVDGLDFFVLDERKKVFEACSSKGIHAVTAAPFGFGTALLVFGPGGMSFEDYFGFEKCKDEVDKAISFLVGLAPSMPHRKYLADASRVDITKKMGPSSAASCQLCAGVASVEVLRILLGRYGTRLAPYGSQFDAYTMKYVKTWRPWGARNPLQVFMRWIIRRMLNDMQRK